MSKSMLKAIRERQEKRIAERQARLDAGQVVVENPDEPVMRSDIDFLLQALDESKREKESFRIEAKNSWAQGLKDSERIAILEDELTAAKDEIERMKNSIIVVATDNARSAVLSEAIEKIEALICPEQFDGNWRNGYSHAQNDSFRTLEAMITTQGEVGKWGA